MDGSGGDVDQTLKYLSRLVGGALTKETHQFSIENTDMETVNYAMFKLKGQINVSLFENNQCE